MAPIPKIIHQTWKTSDIPHEFRGYQRSWRTRHPDWDYRFYDDEGCRSFVEDNYPDLLPVFDRYPKPIQRIDMFRYLVVNRWGGVYADMDLECFKPLDTLLDGKTGVFSIEAHLTSRRRRELGYRQPYQVANCIFASVPFHGFLKRIVDRLLELAHRPVLADGDVEDTTGPRMLTRLYEQLGETEKKDITLLPQIHLLSPKEYPNVFPFNLRMYARHHCAGTWKNRTSSPSLKRLWIERNRLPPLW